MIIPITERIRIDSDPLNWRVSEKKITRSRETGELEESWVPRTFHNTLRSAVESLVERRIKETQGVGIAELQKAAQDAVTLVSKAFEGLDLRLILDVSKTEEKSK